jgi:hypothetical protein
MSCWPPAPDPKTTPTSVRFSSVILKPESASDCLPAATPKWRLDSLRRAAFGSIHSAASKSRISPPAFCAYELTSKRVISAMPDTPLTRFSQAVCLSLPIELMTPSPVTATRRL